MVGVPVKSDHVTGQEVWGQEGTSLDVLWQFVHKN